MCQFLAAFWGISGGRSGRHNRDNWRLGRRFLRRRRRIHSPVLGPDGTIARISSFSASFRRPETGRLYGSLYLADGSRSRLRRTLGRAAAWRRGGTAGWCCHDRQELAHSRAATLGAFGLRCGADEQFGLLATLLATVIVKRHLGFLKKSPAFARTAQNFIEEHRLANALWLGKHRRDLSGWRKIRAGGRRNLLRTFRFRSTFRLCGRTWP